MKKITYSFKQAIQLLINHWEIFLITLLFSGYSVVTQALKISAIFLFPIMLLDLGWFGAKFEFIKQAYERDSLPWKQFGAVLIKNLKRLLPVTLVLYFIGFVILIFSVISYSKWYFRDVPLSQNKETRIMQLTEMFSSLTSPKTQQSLTQLINQFGILGNFTQFVLMIVGIFATVVVMIFVLDNVNLIKSFITSFHFIKNHLQFFVSIIILDIAILIINTWIQSLVLQITSQPSINLLQTHFLLSIPIIFIDLIITITIIIYFLETKKHS